MYDLRGDESVILKGNEYHHYNRQVLTIHPIKKGFAEDLPELYARHVAYMRLKSLEYSYYESKGTRLHLNFVARLTEDNQLILTARGSQRLLTIDEVME